MDPTTKVSPAEMDSTTHTGEDGTKADANRPLAGNASDTLTELAKQNVAPFLAKYHPRQYAPRRAEDGTTSVPRTVNAGYCYRHQPDSKCSRQADEQSMHQLQRVCIPNGTAVFVANYNI
jgi:F-box/WD-40 domain protein MET30